MCIRDSGNKALYFLGVAGNVHHEYLKRPAGPETLPVAGSGDQEQTYDCLEQCLGKLTEKSQHLIRQYYAEDKQAKISLRKSLADQLGISRLESARSTHQGGVAGLHRTLFGE